MKYFIYCGCCVLLISLSGCTVAPEINTSRGVYFNELLKFAKANCLFCYFKKMKYNTKDISEISGGIVQMGNASINKYEHVATLVKTYQPDISEEQIQSIDPDLLKCFMLKTDRTFLDKLEEIANNDMPETYY